MNNAYGFGAVHLVIGPESMLAERSVDDLVASARQQQPAASLTTIEASRLDPGKLAELTGGSLFADASVVVVQDLAELPADLHGPVGDLAEHQLPDLVLILVHRGGTKGKALLDRLKRLGVATSECPAIKPWELPQFAVREARALGGQLDQRTASLLVEAVGSDLRSVCAAVRQLVDDSDGGLVTEQTVRRYFGGRAEVTSFSVADDVLAGRANEALAKLRWALSTGVAPVLVTSAMSAGLRSLGKYLAARDGRIRDADLARTIGVPPWKIKDLQRQARDWGEAGIASAIRLVATTDGEIKGAGSDPGYALETMVLGVSARRGKRPSR